MLFCASCLLGSDITRIVGTKYKAPSVTTLPLPLLLQVRAVSSFEAGA